MASEDVLKAELDNAVALSGLDELDRAERLVTQALQGLTTGGGAAEALAASAVVSWRAGKLTRAVTEADAALSGTERPHRATTLLAIGSLHLGDPVLAARCRDELMASPDPDHPEWGKLVTHVLTLATQGPSAAARQLCGDLSGMLTCASLVAQDPRVALIETANLRYAGRRSEAELVMRTIEQVAAASPSCDSYATHATHVRALLLDDPRRLERAVHDHTSPWSAALGTEHLGLLLEKDDPAKAITELKRALDLYTTMGAMHDAARVRCRLRELGVGTRRSPQRSSTNPAELTEAERSIAYLVASGMTNVQVATYLFLSRHTVDAHLRRVFRKLGVHSRDQLRGLAADLATGTGLGTI